MAHAALLVLLAAAVAHAAADDGILLGVDYYPEQWPLSEMGPDLDAIRDDLGADVVRVGEFMWHHLEPSDGVFNFTLLDAIVDAAEARGLRVMLGTPTATMPAWLYAAHGPDVAAVGPDSPEGYSGARAGFGGRRQYSFNSPTFARYAARVTAKVAARYAGRAAVTDWQIDNELGHEGSDMDFSPMALAAWRQWLAAKYGGGDDGIAALNEAWGTTFWSVTFNAYGEVPLPAWTIPGAPARPNENFRSNSNPGMLLDYRRFRAASVANFSAAQAALVRAALGAANRTGRGFPPARVTTNSPGGVWGKMMDQDALFGAMDFSAYDNYPVWGGSLRPTPPSAVALALARVRGWQTRAGRSAADGTGPGFMVAEQLIGQQGHDIVGYTPRPGQARAWSAQALLRGATALLFFRYRSAVFGQEEFCYGLLGHGTALGPSKSPAAANKNTPHHQQQNLGRRWDEAKATFALARAHAPLWLAAPRPRVALLYGYDNVWSWQAQPQSTAFDFEREASRLHHAFWRLGAAVDVVSASAWLGSGALRARHRAVLLPAPMLAGDALVAGVERFARADGGSVWVGFRADLKDARGQIRRSPSRLAALAGVEIAEFESLNVGSAGGTVRRGAGAAGGGAAVGPGTAAVGVWREGLVVPAGSAAQSLWEYDDAFFGALGYKAATRLRLPARSGSSLGSAAGGGGGGPGHGGEVLYIGAGIDQEALVGAAADTLAWQGLLGSLPGAPASAEGAAVAAAARSPLVEEVVRADTAGKAWLVQINHGGVPANATGGVTLAAYEVAITPAAAA